MKTVYGVIWFSLLCLTTQLMVMKGIPLIHADYPGIWDEYTESQEWHEIGAPDPRYQDPCGPGPHSGQLGEPGCHE